VTQTWKQRRARAAKLGAAHPPAADILAFYVDLLERQESIFVMADRWVTGAAGGRVGGPPIDISRFSSEPQLKAFRRFVKDAASVATPLLATTAARLLESSASADDLLDRFVRGESLAELAASLGCEPEALAFFPRAFIQPVAEAALGRLPDQPAPQVASTTPASCPRCGWPPQLASLVDEADVRGRRLLLCSLCGDEWSFPRATCPVCGETDANQLPHHLSESWAHVRVEECKSCQSYLKAIDLRTDGLAVPVVDEIASVELDLWASEQGLKKAQRNLLGL
jgi:FdhE protein